MNVKDYDYELPEALIAQTPLEKRSDSRLLVLSRETEEITHKHFYDIVDFLTKDDVLVINDTKVMPSRIFGKKVDTDASIELLLLKEILKDEYECLVKPARRIRVGTQINFNDLLRAEVTKKFEDGICHVKLTYQGILVEVLERLGQMPLPPYIHEKLLDQSRYQTVYAQVLGSAAAPTAGLHFTKDILEKIKSKGVEILHVTLHVGLGTFRPISVDDIGKHVMHSELYHIDEETAQQLNLAKANKKRIIAVGTTSTRTLEANIKKYKQFTATTEETDIFIYPGYTFEAIDGLITNFHLPKSTLLMLVSAFSSREAILKSYEEAKKLEYRFFSFGDAMFIH